MSRVLGIDFGEARVGLAMSDPGGRFALPHETVTRSSDRQLIAGLAELIEREGVERVILGEPVGVDGSSGAAARRVRSFGRKLAAATGVEVRTVAETLTTLEAERRLREAGTDPRTFAPGADAVAAQIILEEALAGDGGKPLEDELSCDPTGAA